jgi:hypothetical protein
MYSYMKQFLAAIILFSLFLPPQAQASSWIDRSAEIPTTTLDEYIKIPYLSISKSRGRDWLAGNPNQLFHVLPDRTIDLTPTLKEFGLGSIRQVATDGKVWLIIGDANIWQSRPDLAFIYDGKYFNNVSNIFRNLPKDEWIGQITGKDGLWYIATDKNIYIWHSALNEAAKISVPNSFKEPRLSFLRMHAVSHGWIIEFEQKNGPKSISLGKTITDRRFFFFDGQNYQELTSLFGNISNFSTVGTNGGNILVIGAVINNSSYHYKAFLSDGIKVNDVSGHLKNLLPQSIPPSVQHFLNQATITWSGNSWIFANATNNLSIWNQSKQPQILKDPVDNFLDIGYSKNGTVLISGYKQKQGSLTPLLLQFSL